jgi:hypothetical protein
MSRPLADEQQAMFSFIFKPIRAKNERFVQFNAVTVLVLLLLLLP